MAVFLHACSDPFAFMMHNLHKSIQRLWDVGSLFGEDASQIRRDCCGLYALVKGECGRGLPWESVWTAGVLRMA